MVSRYKYLHSRTHQANNCYGQWKWKNEDTYFSSCIPRGPLLLVHHDETPQLVGILGTSKVRERRFASSARVDNGV